MRGFALVAAAALDGKFARLQTAGSDEARALDFALPTEEQSGETARLRDGRDSIFVAMMLETVCRFADQESLRSEKHFVCEIEARRQLLGRRRRRQRFGSDFGERFFGRQRRIGSELGCALVAGK